MLQMCPQISVTWKARQVWLFGHNSHHYENWSAVILIGRRELPEIPLLFHFKSEIVKKLETFDTMSGH